jgi:hypothetical protein
VLKDIARVIPLSVSLFGVAGSRDGHAPTCALCFDKAANFLTFSQYIEVQVFYGSLGSLLDTLLIFCL